MSQGKTAEQPEPTPEAPKKVGLTPISLPKAQSKLSKPQLVKPTQTLLKKSEPIKRTKVNKEVEQILREEGVPRQLLEEDYKPLDRPLVELSPKEQAERIRQTQERLSKNRRADNPNKLPMPTYEQQEAMAYSRAGVANKSGIGSIMSLLNKRSGANNQ